MNNGLLHYQARMHHQGFIFDVVPNQPEFNQRLFKLGVRLKKIKPLDFFKETLADLYYEKEVIVGQAITPSLHLEPNLKEKGLSANDFSNYLRIVVEEGYLKQYGNDPSLVCLTSKGMKWIEGVQEELGSDKEEPILGKYEVQNADTLSEKISKAEKLNKPISLLFLDLDNFKSVNDNYDHKTGDEVIKETLKIVQEIVFGKGELFHRSGDEIVVLLTNNSEIEAVGVAERIRKTIEAFNFPSVNKGHITASIGIASYPDNCKIDELEVAADKAAMQTKKMGKNKVTVYKELKK